MPKPARVPFLIALGLTAAPFAVAVVKLLTVHQHLYLGGDLALLDLDVRSALRWHLLLGPYDRYGWHHPGPALAYLLSVVARVVGPGAVADSIGIAAINGAAALGVVALVRRRAGDALALWAAGCVALLCIWIRPANLVAPWGPNVLTLPTVFLGVLCADAARNCRTSLLAALVVATFLVQTQLGTTPIVATMLAVAVGSAIWKRHRCGVAKKASKPARAGRWALAAVLVAAWVPPVIEQVQRLGAKAQPPVVSALHPDLAQVDPSQGNFVAIARFFLATHPGHSLGTVLANLVPDPLALAGLMCAAALAVVYGRSVAGGLPARLGALSILAAAATAFAVTRIVGPVQGFDLTWDMAVPALGLLGAGTTAIARADQALARRALRRIGPLGASGDADQTGLHTSRSGGRPLRVRLPAASLVVTLVVALGTGSASIASLAAWQARSISWSSVAAEWRYVGPRLSRARSVLVLPYNGLPYGAAAGLADELTARGVTVTVPRAWAPEFGLARVSRGRAQFEVLLAQGGRGWSGLEPVPGADEGLRLAVVTLDPPA